MKTTKILVIEDEELVRENILELLDANDFYAIGAENGARGIELAKEYIPHLIICDILMPDLDGFTVLKSLRHHSATATIPLIFLTAKVDRTDLRQGMELGANDYITKPYELSELLNAIKTQLEKQAVLVQQSQQKLDNLRKSITLSLPRELHTPLNQVLDLSHTLNNNSEQLEKDEIKAIAGSIYIATQQLNRQVENFLLYTKLEVAATESQKFKPAQIGLTSAPKNIISDCAIQKAQQVNRVTDLHLELQNTAVKIPEGELKKIVDELVDNALKFSPKGTPIFVIGALFCTLSVPHNNLYAICVVDNGQGMTAEQIADMGAYLQFERKVYEQQGSGLGLIIAKRLAELHGGQLTIESIPDRQTIVRVVLPIA
jgi:DNA-binding response OmpR family regulator/anti-sigma regulatory factor (Ser/Thr protein kinase)